MAREPRNFPFCAAGGSVYPPPPWGQGREATTATVKRIVVAPLEKPQGQVLREHGSRAIRLRDWQGSLAVFFFASGLALAIGGRGVRFWSCATVLEGGKVQKNLKTPENLTARKFERSAATFPPGKCVRLDYPQYGVVGGHCGLAIRIGKRQAGPPSVGKEANRQRVARGLPGGDLARQARKTRAETLRGYLGHGLPYPWQAWAPGKGPRLLAAKVGVDRGRCFKIRGGGRAPDRPISFGLAGVWGDLPGEIASGSLAVGDLFWVENA